MYPYYYWTGKKSEAKQNALFKIIKSFFRRWNENWFCSMFFSSLSLSLIFYPMSQTVIVNLFFFWISFFSFSLNSMCLCVCVCVFVIDLWTTIQLGLLVSSSSSSSQSLSQKHFYSSSTKRLQIYFFFTILLWRRPWSHIYSCCILYIGSIMGQLVREKKIQCLFNCLIATLLQSVKREHFNPSIHSHLIQDWI